MSNMKNGNEPCFPQEGAGLTKREYFAAMAMQGIMASWLLAKDNSKYLWNHGNEISTTALAEDARRCADAILAELEKPTEK